jgi:hypothetical protein
MSKKLAEANRIYMDIDKAIRVLKYTKLVALGTSIEDDLKDIYELLKSAKQKAGKLVEDARPKKDPFKLD